MRGELNSNQINNLLSSQVMGRLACCDGKYPYIVPMTYTYDGSNIYGQTNEGKKLEIMRRNPNIAFQVDSYLDIFNWQSVIVYGQFEEIRKEDNEYARELLLKNVMPLMTTTCIHNQGHASPINDESICEEKSEFILFKISIHEKTGRFERQ